MPVQRVVAYSPERPADIQSLSDSSDSDAEPPVAAPRGLKRKRPGTTTKPRRRLKLDDPLGIQLVLSKGCGAGCKRHCKKQFQAKQALQELTDFRKSWQEYHKTDQDQIDAWLCCWSKMFLVEILGELRLIVMGWHLTSGSWIFFGIKP